MSVLRLPFAALAAVLAFSVAADAQAATRPKPSPTRGVVLVSTNLAYEGGDAAGTGIVLTPSGEVLTNNHVIRGATTITVTVPATRRTYPAHVVGYGIVDDVALLKLDGATKLTTATSGNSAKLKVGQATVAVGNANGAGRLVVTKGKITGLAQSVTISDDEGGTTRVSGLIATSAALVPGDSGGPLLDAAGRVIGVDAIGTAGFTSTSGGGYAIPINRALSIVKTIRSGVTTATVHVGGTAFLGVTLRETSGGLVVGSTLDGGAAAAAGITAGAVLTSFDGQTLTTLAGIRTLLFPHHPGDTVPIGYVDASGVAATATVVLGDGPPQ